MAFPTPVVLHPLLHRALFLPNAQLSNDPIMHAGALKGSLIRPSWKRLKTYQHSQVSILGRCDQAANGVHCGTISNECDLCVLFVLELSWNYGDLYPRNW